MARAMTTAASIVRPNAFDRVITDRSLGVAAAIMLGVVAVAVARGHADWARVPGVVWLHLALIGIALVLTPVMLIRRKGTAPHRILGYVWAAAMLSTAVTSLLFNARVAGGHNLGILSGDVSPIHLISLFVLVMVPRLVVNARRHEVARHRRGVRGIVIGAILIAGFFTFPFDRLLGHWLFA